MKEDFFQKFPQEDKERTAYIEGRPDLFETEVLRLKRDTSSSEKKMLAVMRDPGSSGAILPVVKELIKDIDLQLDILADGRAQEIAQKEFSLEDISPEMALGSDKIIGTPKVILMDRSIEIGIDTYVAATFQEVPKVLIEDIYASSIDYIKELIKRNLSLPKKICVMDEEAKRLIIDELPQLVNLIEVTGQPAFDYLAKENTEEIASRVKEKLNLKNNDKLITLMSTPLDDFEEIKAIAKTLGAIGEIFYFVFRKHPRDNVKYEDYKKLFADAGVKIIDTNEFNTSEIGAASDIILTAWSTEGINAIYRRKPVIYISDFSYFVPPEARLPMAPVKLGAGIGADSVKDLKEIIGGLLNGEFNTKELHQNMEKFYIADGKNSERVADIVRKYLE